MIQYIVLILIVLILLFKLYVKITYKFWSYQPVFHYHNILYWLSKPGIIMKELPKINKFCNFTNIKVNDYHNYCDSDKNDIIKLIQNNYSNNKEYFPNIQLLDAHFSGHINKNYVTVYRKDLHIAQDNIINKIIAVITSRPVYIQLNNNIKFDAYYVDWLCVDKEYRKMNIAPQMIQTHEYYQRHDNHNNFISLFKKEGKLTGIVPLTAYNAYQYDPTTLKKEPLDDNYLIEINDKNYNDIDIMYKNQKFDCFIITSKSNIINLIKNNILRIFVLKNKDTILAIYYFKNSYTTFKINQLYQKDPKVCYSIDIIGSIKFCDKLLFIKGFINAILELKKKDLLITIENISNNDDLIDFLTKKQLITRFKIPIAYFYYNYISKPIISNKVFILI